MEPPLRAASGPLVLADISGYTAFLQSVAVAHSDAFSGGEIPAAYGILSGLIDGIVDRLAPPFTLAKLEGDAVFAYGTRDDAIPRGENLLACVRACYAGFHERVDHARSVLTCTCDVCVRMDLELKFVMHDGAFAIQRIAGQQELAGTDVVIVHRLMKNSAAQALGTGAYLLVTEALVNALDVPVAGAAEIVEVYDHLDPVRAFAMRPRREMK